MLLQDEKVFVLDIRSDSNGSRHSSSHNPHVAGPCSVSETIIHRKIIELFKCRDEFQFIDMTVRTSRGLSGTTRVDISNCLAHMRGKGKKLRRLKADMDYMDPSVHEFVVLNCLSFDELCIQSNPLEQACLSPGLAMSIRHALTLNKHCTKILELQCGLSESAAEILSDAMQTAYDLEILKVHLLTGRSTHICGVLDGLQGKSRLRELHLRNVTADVADSLAAMLGHQGCRLQELNLSCPWEGDDDDDAMGSSSAPYNTAQLCAALANITNTSITKLILDGIRFPVQVKEEDGIDAVPDMGGNTTSLMKAFQKLETLSIAAPAMPHLDFLHALPNDQLPKHLKQCYFPCLTSNVQEARNLVERVPTVVDIPDYASDHVVQHFLDWRKIQQNLPKTASVWPHLIQHTNGIMRDSSQRRANMVFNLLKEYHGLHKNGELVFSSRSDDAIDDEESKDDLAHGATFYDNEEKKADADFFGTFDAVDEQDEAGDY
jgi:hypothetical protein